MNKLIKIIVIFLISTTLALASGIGGGSSGIHGIPDPLNISSINTSGISTITRLDGVTGMDKYPYTWYSTAWGIDGTFGFLGQTDNSMTLANDVYKNDAGTWIFKDNYYAGKLQIATTSGKLVYSSSSSTGTSGTAATLSQRFYVGPTGAVHSDYACASGYTRTAVNYCQKDTPSSPTSLTRDTCTTVAVPSGAVTVDVYLESTANTANSVANRWADNFAYTNSSCTTLYFGKGSTADGREFTATTAGNGIGADSITARVTPSSGNIFLELTDDTGNQGYGQYSIQGYQDMP